MSIMPKTGVCYSCGHDHGNGMGSPSTLRILTEHSLEMIALQARAQQLADLLAELLDNGVVYNSAVELEQGFDGEVWEEKALKLLGRTK